MPLTPQAKAFLKEIDEQNATPVENLPVLQGRRMFAALTRWHGSSIEVESVKDCMLPGDIRGRIYRPQCASVADNAPQPAIMFFHGGGWVLGDLETHDALCRRLASESECTVIAVDYSLSPETRYPKSLDECYNATVHVIENATQFNVRSDRVAVAGDSAGGNLAAAVTLRARDLGYDRIDRQILIYPALLPDYEQESYLEFTEGFGLTRQRMIWFWNQYLGNNEADCYAAPCLATNLADLPETLLITAEYDVLRCDGEAFAKRLIESGVATSYKRYHGNLHGFAHFAGMFDDGKRAVAKIGWWCRQHLYR